LAVNKHSVINLDITQIVEVLRLIFNTSASAYFRIFESQIIQLSHDMD